MRSRKIDERAAQGLKRAAISDKPLTDHSDLKLVELTLAWLEKAFKGWDKSSMVRTQFYLPDALQAWFYPRQAVDNFKSVEKCKCCDETPGRQETSLPVPHASHICVAC